MASVLILVEWEDKQEQSFKWVYNPPASVHDLIEWLKMREPIVEALSVGANVKLTYPDYYDNQYNEFVYVEYRAPLIDGGRYRVKIVKDETKLAGTNGTTPFVKQEQQQENNPNHYQQQPIMQMAAAVAANNNNDNEHVDVGNHAGQQPQQQEQMANIPTNAPANQQQQLYGYGNNPAFRQQFIFGQQGPQSAPFVQQPMPSMPPLVQLPIGHHTGQQPQQQEQMANIPTNAPANQQQLYGQQQSNLLADFSDFFNQQHQFWHYGNNPAFRQQFNFGQQQDGQCSTSASGPSSNVRQPPIGQPPQQEGTSPAEPTWKKTRKE